MLNVNFQRLVDGLIFNYEINNIGTRRRHILTWGVSRPDPQDPYTDT